MLDELHSSHLIVWFDAKLNKERVKQDIARDVGRKEHFNFDPGIKLANVEGRRVVDSIAEGSGAQVAGVQRGWILTHWMNCDLGEKVSLSFIDLQEQERNLDVVCKLYPAPRQPPERSGRLLDGALYLRFAEF